MPPCNVKESTNDGSIVEEKSKLMTDVTSTKLKLSEIRNALPADVFQKSSIKAYGYMMIDYSLWFGTVFVMQSLCNSSIWSSLPLYQQIIVSIVYFNIAGFFMWCLFMIGHDAGHGTFSDSSLVNDVIGHISHGSLLVPFYPWQLSHRRHHMYHNHVDKDYSYPWLTDEKMSQPDNALARFFHSSPIMTFLFPFYGWPMYLFIGIADGNHFIPFFGRLWKHTPSIEQVKGVFSSCVVVFAVSVIFYVFGPSLATCAFYYLGPWVMFSWWLVCVTYLQHHDPETVVYDDRNWSFVTAAFETVDRKYGYPIDVLSHHITDGHVIHHLFFTKIPHYNLPRATAALHKYLKEVNLFHLYRFEDSWDFAHRLHYYVSSNGFRTALATDVKNE